MNGGSLQARAALTISPSAALSLWVAQGGNYGLLIHGVPGGATFVSAEPAGLLATPPEHDEHESRRGDESHEHGAGHRIHLRTLLRTEEESSAAASHRPGHGPQNSTISLPSFAPA